MGSCTWEYTYLSRLRKGSNGGSILLVGSGWLSREHCLRKEIGPPGFLTPSDTKDSNVKATAPFGKDQVQDGRPSGKQHFKKNFDSLTSCFPWILARTQACLIIFYSRIPSAQPSILIDLGGNGITTTWQATVSQCTCPKPSLPISACKLVVRNEPVICCPGFVCY